MKDGKRAIFYHGRVDSQVKVRGHRVELNEILDAVQKLPEVDKAVVLCWHTGLVDQAIIAYILPKEGGANKEKLAAKLGEDLKKLLQGYQLPIIQIIDDLPLLSSGKTDRQKLLGLYEEERKKRKWTFIDFTNKFIEPTNRGKRFSEKLRQKFKNKFKRNEKFTEKVSFSKLTTNRDCSAVKNSKIIFFQWISNNFKYGGFF